MNALLKTLTLLLVLLSSLNADETGSASIFSFYNGVALEKNEVLVDGEYKYFTDEDGSVELILETGKHQIEIFAKDENGQNLGYTKKTIEIKESRDTQVIATFKDDSLTPYVDVDTPVGKLAKEMDVTENTGILHGLVLSTEKNLPIANARVFVKGTSIDAKTDEKGNFYVEIPADIAVSISIVHSEYSAQTINDILVKKDETINTEVKLTPASMELEEFVVLAPKVEGSIASIMAEEKSTNAIANIIGSDQMSKKGDSDAASALKRVTGVTIIGGKDIYVRGLGDRYSNVEMNSMPLPSPNPTKRVVPLDIFPSGVIGSMKVQKSATADIPASFGGGYVDIRTKDSAKDDYAKISIGIKGNSNTGISSPTYQGSSNDQFGFDNGYRDIDPSVLENSSITVGERQKAFTTRYFSKDELSKFTQKYIGDRNYNTEAKSLPIGGNIGLEGAVNFEIADKHKLTFFGNYKYEQDHKYRKESWSRYGMDFKTGKLYEKANQKGVTYKSTSEYTQSAMINAAYSYQDVFNVKYTKLFTHNGNKRTRVVDGILGSNDEPFIKYYLDWEERTLDADQINGTLDYELFNQETNFRFGAESAVAKLDQPNNYAYSYLDDGTGLNGDPFLTSTVANHLATNITSEDTVNAYYLKNKFHFDLLSEDDFLDLGYTNNDREKTFRQNIYYLGYTSEASDNDMTADVETVYNELVRPDIDYDDRHLLLGTLSQPSDQFDATVKEENYYLNTFLKPLENLEVLVGARQVNITQTMFLYDEDRVNPGRKIIKTPETLTVDELYPSMSLKYILDKDNHIDLAYSTTYIMPDLIEASSGSYVHPYEVADVEGNPDLVNTNIASYDLQFSHYFSDNENIKVGVFYKNLDKPIENVMLPTSSLPRYSFDNADKATIMGFELDGRKSFNVIAKELKNYYLSGNFSYNDSEVTLRKEQVPIYTTNHRELQGLSKTIINVALSYEVSDRSATLSYNKMGERIRKVGLIGDPGTPSESKFPDYMEDPASILDFVWIEKFKNGLAFKLKLGNLLDEETVWYQDTKKNTTNSFKKGRDYSFAFSYKY